jgi:hypothetical protein
MEKTTNPGYGPVFEYLDDPKDPDNAARLAEAQRFRRENPNGLIIHDLVVSPPDIEFEKRLPSRERLSHDDKCNDEAIGAHRNTH